MVEPVDEYVLLTLTEYAGKKLISVTKGDLNLDDVITEKDRSNCEDLIKLTVEILGDNIMKVEITNRLTDSPCCLISDINGYSANMERIIKTESFKLNTKLSKSTRIFEINPNHSIIKILCDRIRIDKTCNSIRETIWVLYELSIITSGLNLNNTLDFNKRILGLVEKDLNNI
jgi:molecular chaperone HtpG